MKNILILILAVVFVALKHLTLFLVDNLNFIAPLLKCIEQLRKKIYSEATIFALMTIRKYFGCIAVWFLIFKQYRFALISALLMAILYVVTTICSAFILRYLKKKFKKIFESKITLFNYLTIVQSVIFVANKYIKPNMSNEDLIHCVQKDGLYKDISDQISFYNEEAMKISTEFAEKYPLYCRSERVKFDFINLENIIKNINDIYNETGKLPSFGKISKESIQG